MKFQKLIISLGIVIIISSCNRTKDISLAKTDNEIFISSAKFFSDSSLPYQTFKPFVKFKTTSEIPHKNQTQLLKEQEELITNSGLPNHKNISLWIQNHSLNDAINSYVNFIKENQKHIYINSFKQYGSWLILTKLKLLSTTDEKSIAYFTNELISTNYIGFDLLLYNLNKLDALQFSKPKINSMAKSILDYAKQLNNKMQKVDTSKIQFHHNPNYSQTMKEGIENGIKSYYASMKLNDKTIKEIEKLTTQ